MHIKQPSEAFSQHGGRNITASRSLSTPLSGNFAPFMNDAG